MTGLHLLDQALTISEITTHASSCHVTEEDDVITMSIFEVISNNGINLLVASNCDEMNECDPNPCNSHVCVDGRGAFTCQCASGWTGLTCDTPPDFCIGNGCKNGATCVSVTADNGYTCQCLLGYSGVFCEVAPVDGGWSDWVITTTCSQNCGSGTQTRTRVCDSPVPDQYGADCIGEDTETIACNTDPCRVCDDMDRKIGTWSNCTTDHTTGSRQCTLYCVEGGIIPTGLGDEKQTYNCGPETNYEWESSEALPSCIAPTAPGRLDVITGIDYETEIAEEDHEAVINNISENLETSPCNGVCDTTVDISNESKKRRRRNSGSTLTIKYSITITPGTDLDYAAFVTNGTVSPALQNLIDSVNTLEETSQYLQNHTVDIFTSTVNGVTYTPDIDSLTAEGIVSCPIGSIELDGICLECPAGSYSDGTVCSFCEKGSYQPSPGQTSCTPCPVPLTTETIASTDPTECSDTVTETTTKKKDDDDSSEGGKTTLMIALIISIVALLIAALALTLVWYKKFRPRRQVSNSAIDLRGPPRLQTEITNRRYSVHHSKSVYDRPASAGQISFVCDYPSGKEVDLNDDTDYLTPRSRDGGSPPPPYVASSQEGSLPGYSQAASNPYYSIIEAKEDLNQQTEKANQQMEKKSQKVEKANK